MPGMTDVSLTNSVRHAAHRLSGVVTSTSSSGCVNTMMPSHRTPRRRGSMGSICTAFMRRWRRSSDISMAIAEPLVSSMFQATCANGEGGTADASRHHRRCETR
jgi:hypothetical protein